MGEIAEVSNTLLKERGKIFELDARTMEFRGPREICRNADTAAKSLKRKRTLSGKGKINLPKIHPQKQEEPECEAKCTFCTSCTCFGTWSVATPFNLAYNFGRLVELRAGV